MSALRMTLGVLIVASVLLNSSGTASQLQPEHLLETLTTLTTLPLLEQRCATYERTIRTFMPVDQKATASKDELYAHVMSQAKGKQSLNAEEKRVVDDIGQCIALEKEQMINGVQPEIRKEAGSLGVLSQLKLEIEHFEQDLVYFTTQVTTIHGIPSSSGILEIIISDKVNMINNRVDGFHQLLKMLLATALNNIEPLKAIRRQESQQYELIQEALSKLESESEFEQFRQKLVHKITRSNTQSGFEEFVSVMKQLCNYLAALNGKLDSVSSDFVAVEHEFQQRVGRKASKEALSKLESEFEYFKSDMSRLLTYFYNVNEEKTYFDHASHLSNIRNSIELIREHVSEFKSVMTGQLERALSNIDALGAKQEQGDKHYVSIKEESGKLRSEFKKFEKSLAETFSGHNRLSSMDQIHVIYTRLEELKGVLKGFLKTASDYIGH